MNESLCLRLRRSEEHTSELQSRENLVCRLLLEKKKPIRIGDAIVLPGDLVIATREGVLFVRAHMAEQVVSTSEFVTRKDKFGFEMVRTGTYSTGDIDRQ